MEQEEWQFPTDEEFIEASPMIRGALLQNIIIHYASLVLDNTKIFRKNLPANIILDISSDAGNITGGIILLDQFIDLHMVEDKESIVAQGNVLTKFKAWTVKEGLQTNNTFFTPTAGFPKLLKEGGYERKELKRQGHKQQFIVGWRWKDPSFGITFHLHKDKVNETPSKITDEVQAYGLNCVFTGKLEPIRTLSPVATITDSITILPPSKQS